MINKFVTTKAATNTMQAEFHKIKSEKETFYVNLIQIKNDFESMSKETLEENLNMNQQVDELRR